MSLWLSRSHVYRVEIADRGGSAFLCCSFSSCITASIVSIVQTRAATPWQNADYGPLRFFFPPARSSRAMRFLPKSHVRSPRADEISAPCSSPPETSESSWHPHSSQTWPVLVGRSRRGGHPPSSGSDACHPGLRADDDFFPPVIALLRL